MNLVTKCEFHCVSQHTQGCGKLTSIVRIMKIWIKTFIKDFCHFLYRSSLNVIQELLQTGLRGEEEEGK